MGTKATNPINPTGDHRSSRNKQAPKSFIPSMKGTKYQYSALQLNSTKHDPAIVEFILTQLTLKAALKLWGNEAAIAAEAEMKQSHWRNSFKPVRWEEISEAQKASILELHIFMKMKESREIKGMTVTGGNKQQCCINKEDSSFLPVATESVILTSVVYKRE